MSKNLVIVESPAKVKTIKKFLGSNYTVDASGGHVRDLPKSQLGIDVTQEYEPRYITIRGKGDTLARLRKEVKKADHIYLATDPDREGEAISWHLSKALKLDEAVDKKVSRITFNEITKNAVKASLKAPRKIDMDLVDAQQARRVLDRLVGYMISPLLWEKVKRGLSAGRVQSVALRMICDREDEINSFIPEEYWTVDAELAEGKKKLIAHYYGRDGKKYVPASEEEVNGIKKELEHADFTVAEVKNGVRSKKPPLPFTTSTLQQVAASNLNFSTSKTMRLAQQLYEGVEIKGLGTIALITYLRTDSTRISEEADAAGRRYISENYGEKYAGGGNTTGGKNDAKIQDAHEAIRPVNVELTPTEVKDSLPRDLFRLYHLIWTRFVASRMTPASYETTSVKIAAGRHLFSLSASRILFDGFLSVYSIDSEKEEKNALTESLEMGQKLSALSVTGEQHFTQPPAHYTEASLVRALEEDGIGRPSTYAPTISTILNRRYITKEKKNLYVTELGDVVNRIMKKAFPTIVDTAFTANMEYLLDRIGDGSVKWKTVIENFYPDLDDSVAKAKKELESVKIADEVTDEICEVCGRNMVIKYGPHGKFLACPGFPDCRNTRPYLEKIGVACPKCGKDLVIRKSKKGRVYYGCSSYPDCEFMSWQKPSAEKCPNCGTYMVEKGNKLMCANKNCGFVKNLGGDEKN
ncbi:DNA topoisomerase-1 [[Clostridium] aminophilum]|uniref:DNA topoisomerase 1 n=1 Tax=[Clostridium] aminophilum TaxID=1526 RepID=A0A1I0BL09_9FIRM|nr:type I DNA topoisomerase [[Clostridium] aminophilum]SET07687.1 DNA topoisomerase-1 [[Clostridium] aminophilum]